MLSSAQGRVNKVFTVLSVEKSAPPLILWHPVISQVQPSAWSSSSFASASSSSWSSLSWPSAYWLMTYVWFSGTRSKYHAIKHWFWKMWQIQFYRNGEIQSKDPHPPTEFYFPSRLTDLSQINPLHRDRAPPHQRWLMHISTEQQLIPFSSKKGPITDFDSRREILDLRLSRKSANPVSRPNKSCLFLAQICRHSTAGQFANAGKNLTVDHQIDLARLCNSYDLD